MQDCLYDISWSTFNINKGSRAFNSIFDASATTSQQHASRLTSFLSQHGPQYVDELDDEAERLGTLKECRWHAPSSSSSSISVQLIYQKQTFKFMLYSSNLILGKAPPSHQRRFFDFLTDTWGISVDVLKAPAFLLQQALAQYVGTITAAYTHGEDEANRSAILKTAIGNLRITIAFSGTVAPHLKTLDLDVPHDTVESLMQANKDATGSQSFLANLAYHITDQTGLKLPLEATDAEAVDSPPLRISRITSSAFAISTEGKIKFAAKAVEAVPSFEHFIRRANEEMLNLIDREARRQGSGSND